MRLSSLMNIWIIGFEIICELYHNPDISLWTIKALQHKARLKKSLIHFIDTLDICHHLMCLSWDWVCWAPSVTIVSNNVIRTIIIKYDIPFILEYYWDQNTRLKLFLIGFAVIPTGDEVQYCGWMFQENSLYTPHHCPSMASFPPMEARQWAGNLLACRQASKWPRWAKVWMFESNITSPEVKYVKKKNGTKMPYEFFILQEWTLLHSSLLALSYTHWLSSNTKKIKGTLLSII